MLDAIKAHEFLAREAGRVTSPTGGGHEAKVEGKSFAETLSALMKETDALQKSADKTLEDFSKGKVENLHDVMISMSKADLSFRMLLEVRNKLVEAYTEVMRTQV